MITSFHASSTCCICFGHIEAGEHYVEGGWQWCMHRRCREAELQTMSVARGTVITPEERNPDGRQP